MRLYILLALAFFASLLYGSYGISSASCESGAISGKQESKNEINKTKSVLQQAIDSAKENSVINLPKGIYKGNIVIDKPITIDGLDKGAVILGDGDGSVIKIFASNVTLKNLTIKGSGTNHDTIDSAISAKDSFKINILDNHIEDALYGVDFEKVNMSKVEGNFITSKKGMDLGLRGDAIRLWYSNENSIAGNVIKDSRDTVFWYSSGNRIENNIGSHCRYSLHFMYAGKNLVQNTVSNFITFAVNRTTDKI